MDWEAPSPPTPFTPSWLCPCYDIQNIFYATFYTKEHCALQYWLKDQTYNIKLLYWHFQVKSTNRTYSRRTAVITQSDTKKVQNL